MLRSITCLTRSTTSSLRFRTMATSASAPASDREQDLIAQITTLTQQLASLRASNPTSSLTKPTPPAPKKRKPPSKPFDFSRYPTRKIALLLTYQGWHHGGLSWQPDQTPLTTVEGELFKALLRARLIPFSGNAPVGEDEAKRLLEGEEWRERVDMEAWDWQRAGRTDAGVSGAGQVVSFWVRSALVDPSVREREVEEGRTPAGSFRDPVTTSPSSPTTTATNDPAKPPPPPNTTELPYLSHLNSLLPPSVRILAWSPVLPTFSARFSCLSRHYKYFFSTSSPSSFTPPLDLPLMQDAATRLIGERDFRNLCRLDRGKQMTSWQRKVLSASISHVHHDMYVFDLIGTAFLYNQVRTIVAILFLIGAHLELPTLISHLLHTSSLPNPDLPPTTPTVNTKPEFPIASDLPLVLWECRYPEGEVQWQWEEQDGKCERGMRESLERATIKAQIEAHHILRANLALSTPIPSPAPKPNGTTYEPLGAGSGTTKKKYVPVLERKRLEPYEVLNQRWLLSGKGEKWVKGREAIIAGKEEEEKK